MSEIETPAAEVIIPPAAPQRLEVVVRDVREAATPVAQPAATAIAEAPGVSLRDWFAGQALSGYIVKGGGNSVEYITTMSYRFADAMVRARDRSPS